MSEKDDIQQQVRERFRQFLVANKLRQTSERYAILRAAYDIDGTFTIEDLSEVMQQQRFRVSTTTLYNVTSLLVQANLLIRHPFSSSTNIFERIADTKPRSYQICGNCHRITRIKSKVVAEAVESYHPRTFAISHRIMYIYGTCPSCQRAMHKQLRASDKNNN